MAAERKRRTADEATASLAARIPTYLLQECAEFFSSPEEAEAAMARIEYYEPERENA
jgi:hypothetical protein